MSFFIGSTIRTQTKNNARGCTAAGQQLSGTEVIIAMFEKEKKEMLECALQMKEYQLISLTGGNVSMRMPDGLFLVTPSGMYYEKMVPDDIVVIDGKGNVVEGCRKPSSDTPGSFVYV